MAKLPPFVDQLVNTLRRNVKPTATAGAMGTPLYAGYVEEKEVESKLRGREKYRTYSRLLANTSIVAAGVRFFLNLAGSVEWKIEPALDKDGDASEEAKKFAEKARKAIFEQPDTPLHRIVRRAAMYRFYGFSVQEWTAERHSEGFMGFKDVAPRAQLTIERWDVDRRSGQVIGVVQRDPYDANEIYLPRDKVVYLVDDSLNDSPEGLGLFRHIVKHAETLETYEFLEGVGYSNDLRGIPIGRGPFEELDDAVAKGTMTPAEREEKIAPLKAFLKNHVKTGKTSMALDSAVYETTDDKQTPSSNKKWDIDIVKAPGVSPMSEMAQAIQRVNYEIARILGVEGLLIGSQRQGSFALSKDKSQNFFLIIEGTLRDVKEAMQKDLIDRLWELNGWPEDKKPKITHAKVQYQDAQDVAETLAAMARAGAPVEFDDPIIREVRHLLGLSPPTEESIKNAEAEAELRRLTMNREPTPTPGAPGTNQERPLPKPQPSGTADGNT